MSHSMTDSIGHSIAARMADWSTNYLSPESCVLSPCRALRILNYRGAPTPGARIHRPSHAAMRRCAARVGGGR